MRLLEITALDGADIHTDMATLGPTQPSGAELVKILQMLFSLYFSFVNVYFFYIYVDNGSGFINVFKTNKHFNIMQNY